MRSLWAIGIVGIIFLVTTLSTPKTLKSGAVSRKEYIRLETGSGVCDATRGHEACGIVRNRYREAFGMWIRLDAYLAQRERGEGTVETWHQLFPDLQHQVGMLEQFNAMYKESMQGGQFHRGDCLSKAFLANALLMEQIRKLEEKDYLEEPLAKEHFRELDQHDIFASVKLKAPVTNDQILSMYREITDTLERHLQPAGGK